MPASEERKRWGEGRGRNHCKSTLGEEEEEEEEVRKKTRRGYL
jgi:hypothetical protein